MLYKSKHPHKVFSNLQSYLDKIPAWLKKLRLKANNAKSASIFFKNKKFTPGTNHNFKLNDEPIPWSTDYK